MTDVLCQKMAQIYFTVDTKTDWCNTIFALWAEMYFYYVKGLNIFAGGMMIGSPVRVNSSVV